MARHPDFNPLRLSPEQLRLSGQALFGDSPGWQLRLAAHMGFDRSSITRWLNGSTPVPLHASLLVRYMLAHGLPSDAGLEKAPTDTHNGNNFSQQG